LQNAAFSDGGGLKYSDGSLFFGGGEGLNYITPAKDVKSNKNPPPVFLTGLQADNKEVTAGKDAPITERCFGSQSNRASLQARFRFKLQCHKFHNPATE
jgi:hypothetical protein